MMQKWLKDTLNAIENGSEVVIISASFGDDSAIFWMENGVIYSFNRSFGIMERTDMNIDRLKNHLQNMHNEGASMFVRGYRN